MDKLISKEKAIIALTKSNISRDEKLKAIGLIDSLPSAEKTGKWIKGYADPLELVATYTCSNCKSMELAGYNYCSNCGAKMENK